ncbi:hypothetical protein GGX14DRAFT_580305 [Mycena pura]|uniref:Uncharacterized protein n=1 Tax=Mycena pura TaxID=153505 RepID=A0AAD6XXQ6_9AGAR|nr:hypothetical protein GGX14DRAFT_580305 [Mycena pura]
MTDTSIESRVSYIIQDNSDAQGYAALILSANHYIYLVPTTTTRTHTRWMVSRTLKLCSILDPHILLSLHASGDGGAIRIPPSLVYDFSLEQFYSDIYRGLARWAAEKAAHYARLHFPSSSALRGHHTGHFLHHIDMENDAWSSSESDFDSDELPELEDAFE